MKFNDLKYKKKAVTKREKKSGSRNSEKNVQRQADGVPKADGNKA